MRHKLATLAFTACIWAAACGAAAAGAASPGIAGAVDLPGAEPVPVRWVCNDGRCLWQPHSRVRVPVYAQSWGPPTRPNCSYIRRVGPQGQAHWQQVCR
ncbi:hypothetical protein EZH22_17425 [Xanthobacter dioxanivorans]|uniref:Secreted protein n=1 Tax=Xanthobacter dioxanivorans TaxID=2528964 RepID=A0A974PJV5_9HYPH|nr:hypothetical protein [Xanthobacter dioxanivorans]QRG04918.1 hypothetical protein EZH22_17425 [Xanthobacter dioxanivorans]